MRIAYNSKTSAALTVAPSNNDITFDLSGTAIYARGVKFNGKAYNVFKKHASGNTGGYDGLVPVPSYTTTNIRFLREDGTWSIPTAMASIYIQLTNQNLDNYLDEGKWYYAGGGNSVTNKPNDVDAFELYVGRNANGYRYQKLITSNGIIWFRYYNATSWQTWVRWYTDQNTDQKVLQSATTTSGFRPIILGYTNTSTPSDLSASVTQQVYTTTSIYAQPSTGSLWANKLYSGEKLVLTEHQSLANYVTLNTAQTITGIKTFNTNCLQISGSTNFTTILSSKNTSINTTLRDNIWRIYHSNGSGTDRGLSIWSYGKGINNEVLSISAYNIGSTLANHGSAVNSLYMHGIIKATSTITGSGFVKSGSSDNYMLLGGGGHKLISDFMLKTDELSNNLTTITKSLNVTQEWMDTGIKYTDLPATGTYIVQVAVYASNDGIWDGYWSGVMTWYGDSTNGTDANEILLHQASHTLGNNNIYLRTLNTVKSDGRHLRLQISASKNLSAAYTFTFKFKRII